MAITALVYVTFVPTNPLDRFTILPLQIFDWVGRPQEDFQSLAAASIIILLVMLLSMNALAIFLRNKYQKEVGGNRMAESDVILEVTGPAHLVRVISGSSRNVTMGIEQNKVTALIGPSGCGKSTLLRCFQPDERAGPRRSYRRRSPLSR